MKLPQAKNCKNCTKLFQPKHPKGQFCGGTCRQSWNRKKNKRVLKAFKSVSDDYMSYDTEKVLKPIKRPKKDKIKAEFSVRLIEKPNGNNKLCLFMEGRFEDFAELCDLLSEEKTELYPFVSTINTMSKYIKMKRGSNKN